MEVDILSLFPAYFRGPFDVSMVQRARDAGLLDIRLVDIRDFAENKHRRVDDRPFGGGPGMVLCPGPVASAIRSVKKGERSRTIYLTPQGKPLTAERCQELALEEHLILLCGHYEGVDERVLESEIDEEISIGDYVLTNGCIAAIVLIDAVMRFIPGVIGHPDAAKEDSFQNGLLDAPHYTRPEVFEGKSVPQVLLQGNHAEIRKWRLGQALEKTNRVRPDLADKVCLI
ncbi:MAG TPA: tRNA (guanosine(37)-N1)-methyltransferase TrmD [Parachlamydiales bacterium]|nr:tRNA (guanosine(37)-N1)-methyltransferase TrmD [Parachlamydiales bacterium]